MPRPLVPIAALFLALALPAAALAGPGDPDPTFSGDGMLTTGFGTTPFHAADTGSAAVRDGSGNIYIAGSTPANNGDIALVRLTSAGALDPSFGGNGIVTTDVATDSADRGVGVLIDGDGNIVVAGTTGDNGSGNDFVLVRYTSSGALDTTFGGGDGIATADFAGGEDDASGVARLASGNLVVAGTADTDPSTDIDSNDFALASFTQTGALDASFDGDGKLTTDFGSDDDRADAVIATGSNLVVAGTTDPSGADPGDFAVARYTGSSGALDSSFDGDGKQTVDFGGTTASNADFANAVAADSTGRIVLAGSSPSASGNSDFSVVRLTSGGTLDSAFSGDGKATIDFPSANSADVAQGVAIGPSDGIIVVGQTGSENGSVGAGAQWLIAKLDSAGTPDAGFDSDGMVVTDFKPGNPSGEFTDRATAVFVAGTNLIVTGTGNDNFAAARYTLSSGALDTTFGANSSGKVEVDVVAPVPSSETAVGTAVQPDGKIVVVGPTNAGPASQFRGDSDFGLARYNSNGSLDSSFGAGGTGLVTTNFSDGLTTLGSQDVPAGVALQSDGKIVVAGRTDPPGSDQGDFALARYLPNGNLDPDFGGGDGLVTTDFGGTGGDAASGVAVEGTPGTPGFRIVVAGTKTGTSSSRVVAVASYDEDGAPDSGFNGGQQTTDLGGVNPTGGVALQPDGKVLVAATKGSFFPSPNDFALIRYDTDGAPDPDFGTDGNGVVVTDFAGGTDLGATVAVQDLGAGQVRIIEGGKAAPDTGSTDDGGLAAFKTDGSLDSSFAPGGTDGDGKLTFDMASNQSFDEIRGLAIQPDGKIVGVGSVGSPDFGAVRVTSAGGLDPTFGGDGLASTAFPNPASAQLTAFGVALQPDGKIVAAGGAIIPQNGTDLMVARYGAPDVVTPPPPPPSGGSTGQPAAPKKKCKRKKKKRAASVAKKKCKKKKKKQ
jgi:uncharacterized delta-60 repeat protein